ncbi:MAG TPA: ABC transporter permease [Methylomirabilota bacterium]|jgi:peptide/nickel transport system permease protein|nr:ABC transporter permease [Methylomirabilota bacterium]
MATTEGLAAALPAVAAPRARWRLNLAAVRRSPLSLAGSALVVLFVLMAALAPMLAPYAPEDQIAKRLSPPQAAYWLGTDEFGRDILSRIVFGARISLWVGVIAVGIALAGGATTGLVSGYFGGRLDILLMRVMDVMFSLPPIILAITLTGILGPGLTNAMVAIGLVYLPTFARLARGPVLTVSAQEYVEAARAAGAGAGRIIGLHVLPNVAAPLIVQTTLALSTAILAEATLSFLGLGIQPPEPSWGTMLGTGRKYMELAPWVAIFPGAAVMLLVLGFNLLGDGLRDVLDPRLRP